MVGEVSEEIWRTMQKISRQFQSNFCFLFFHFNNLKGFLFLSVCVVCPKVEGKRWKRSEQWWWWWRRDRKERIARESEKEKLGVEFLFLSIFIKSPAQKVRKCAFMADRAAAFFFFFFFCLCLYNINLPTERKRRLSGGSGCKCWRLLPTTNLHIFQGSKTVW